MKLYSPSEFNTIKLNESAEILGQIMQNHEAIIAFLAGIAGPLGIAFTKVAVENKLKEKANAAKVAKQVEKLNSEVAVNESAEILGQIMSNSEAIIAFLVGIGAPLGIAFTKVALEKALKDKEVAKKVAAKTASLLKTVDK